MAGGDTRTGAVLEQMILPALRRGGYFYQIRANIGQRLGGGKHFVDIVATDAAGCNKLISLKWQQVSGTAEQKVPFEAMCLAEAVGSSGGRYAKAYLVLGGAGWKLRSFYTGGGLSRYLRALDYVSILDLESFIGLANKGGL
jgi:PD-(D/E)XK nuclease superfamily protein